MKSLLPDFVKPYERIYSRVLAIKACIDLCLIALFVAWAASVVVHVTGVASVPMTVLFGGPVVLVLTLLIVPIAICVYCWSAIRKTMKSGGPAS